ncbi:MAG: leucyl aminopeptidase [Terriglobales bacterium]
MNTELLFSATGKLAQVETEALLVVAGESAPAAGTAADAAIAELYQQQEFTGKAMEIAILHHPAGMRARRLVLAGRGTTAFGVLDAWRLLGAVARQLKGKGVHQITLVLPDALPAETAAWAAVTAVASANFEPGVYRSDHKPDQQITALALIPPAGADRARLERAAHEAAICAEAQRFARQLANEPGNRLTPAMLGERAQAMARQAGLACELIGPDRARELKMGAFLAVAQGSAEPPCMMVLRYNGAAAPAGPTLGIIGKGITFDSGGISIKPAANMDLMKFDMCGGAATLAAMQAIAALKLNLNVIAVVAAAENMPGGRAQKPGDVHTAMSGKTIEVLNTDAEGRMVLADAIHYAKTLGATHLIDSATLTGSVVVALGQVNTGVFSNHDPFYHRLEEARARSGEKMWRLPLDQEYSDQIKGSIGDILNTGGRWGGAITAAAFLQAFVGDTPWIHLDIAGTAWLEENKPWMPKGPTGAPTYTLIELARELAAT